MSKIGFSKDFLTWTLSYVSKRKQFVQIDGNCSEVIDIHFGVPQGSILGPVLFNIYVADLQEAINVKSYQYADDTTMYKYARAQELSNCRKTMTQSNSSTSGPKTPV